MLDNIFAKRRAKLRELMHARGLDAVLISYDANRFYLSGFELHDGQAYESSGALIVTLAGDDYLLTDARYLDAAKKIWPHDKICLYKRDVEKVYASLLTKVGSRIGLELQYLSQSFYQKLGQAAKKICFVACDGLVEELRQIKDATEISALEKSFALNHAMLAWLEGQLREGLSEQEISWLIEQYFREHGALELAFPSIVAVNQNAALPHAHPSATKLVRDCLVLADVGCRVDNYCSDQTRTFWFGQKPTVRFQSTLALVKEAQYRAIEMMRPGVACQDVYFCARKVFEAKGLADFFTHGLGHGVGLLTHEQPSLSPTSTATLAKGMVVTVEPGLYFSDWGGVRWEHTVVVEDNGVRIL